ncbi:MAG: hypothetical protein U5L08_04345 [Xanthomonadales bacterium]|nr:hypothetical protein [Xanthomonadales bacterium]
MDETLLGLLVLLGTALVGAALWLADVLKTQSKKPNPEWIDPTERDRLKWESERAAKAAREANRKRWEPSGPSDDVIASHKKQRPLSSSIRWAKPRLTILGTWAVLVFTYFLLIKPYGDLSDMRDDEWLQFWLWVFLPPLVSAFVYKITKKLVTSTQ